MHRATGRRTTPGSGWLKADYETPDVTSDHSDAIPVWGGRDRITNFPLRCRTAKLHNPCFVDNTAITESTGGEIKNRETGFSERVNTARQNDPSALIPVLPPPIESPWSL